MVVSRVEDVRVGIGSGTARRVAGIVLLCLRVLLIPGEADHLCARPEMAAPGSSKDHAAARRHSARRMPGAGAWQAPGTDPAGAAPSRRIASRRMRAGPAGCSAPRR